MSWRFSFAPVAGCVVLASLILGQGGVPKSSLLTPLDFGAIGDGLADDTVALQRAIDATQNGGSLYFPGGRKYLVRSLVATGEIHWFGPGGSWLNDRAADGAVIIQGDHANADLLTLTNAAYSNISGVAFDGNRLNQTKKLNGIRLVNCEFTRFDNIYVTSCSGHGILLENVNDLQTSDEIDLVDCYSVLNGLDGVHFDFRDGKAVSAPGDCEIIGGHYDFNFGAGIGLHVSSYTSINGANVLSNQREGIRAIYCTGLNITGNMVRNNQRQGILLGDGPAFTKCTNCALIGNQVHLNSRVEVGKFANIDVGFGSSHTRIIGNYAGDVNPSEKSPKGSKYGLWLHDGATDSAIVANAFPPEDNVVAGFMASPDATYTATANVGLRDVCGPQAAQACQSFSANGADFGTIKGSSATMIWVAINGTSGGTINLPPACDMTAGQTVVVKDTSGSKRPINIRTADSKIDGRISTSLASPYGAVRLRFDGAAWWSW